MPSAVIVESCAYTLEEVDHSIFLFSYDCHLVYQVVSTQKRPRELLHSARLMLSRHGLHAR